MCVFVRLDRERAGERERERERERGGGREREIEREGGNTFSFCGDENVFLFLGNLRLPVPLMRLIFFRLKKSAPSSSSSSTTT